MVGFGLILFSLIKTQSSFLLPKIVICPKNRTKKNPKNVFFFFFRILSLVNDLQIPDDFELFSKSVFAWLREPDENGNYNIKEVVEDAVIQGATDWWVSDNYLPCKCSWLKVN